jgi:hypothetical protein
MKWWAGLLVDVTNSAVPLSEQPEPGAYWDSTEWVRFVSNGLESYLEELFAYFPTAEFLVRYNPTSLHKFAVEIVVPE